jgi:hypothetical protein
MLKVQANITTPAEVLRNAYSAEGGAPEDAKNEIGVAYVIENPTKKGDDLLLTQGQRQGLDSTTPGDPTRKEDDMSSMREQRQGLGSTTSELSPSLESFGPETPELLAREGARLLLAAALKEEINNALKRRTGLTTQMGKG